MMQRAPASLYRGAARLNSMAPHSPLAPSPALTYIALTFLDIVRR